MFSYGWQHVHFCIWNQRHFKDIWLFFFIFSPKEWTAFKRFALIDALRTKKSDACISQAGTLFGFLETMVKYIILENRRVTLTWTTIYFNGWVKITDDNLVGAIAIDRIKPKSPNNWIFTIANLNHIWNRKKMPCHLPAFIHLTIRFYACQTMISIVQFFSRCENPADLLHLRKNSHFCSSAFSYPQKKIQ